MTFNLLVLGASYGSLLSTKLLMAGHRVRLVCTRPTAELINREGTVVRFPVKGRGPLLDVPSGQLPGSLVASTPDRIDPSEFDLVVLGMQEAQYGSPGVRELMGRVARTGVPSLAIADQRDFLSDLPMRVAQTGIQKWSLNVTAFSYATVPLTNRTGGYPVMLVNRDGADEVIVQYACAGSKYHEFVLVGD